MLQQKDFNQYEDGKFNNYIVINPKVISTSEELIYASEGEGCLSVNRDVEGIIPRYARITIEAMDIDGNKFKINDESIKQIIIGGVRCEDHLLRLLLAGVPREKIKYTKNIKLSRSF